MAFAFNSFCLNSTSSKCCENNYNKYNNLLGCCHEVVPYMQYTKMDSLRLKIPLLPNDIIRKLLNLNKTPLSAYLCL